jgi:hypothetical protein
VQLVAIGLGHPIDPVAIEQQLARLAIVDEVGLLRRRAGRAEQGDQEDGAHICKASRCATSS